MWRIFIESMRTIVLTFLILVSCTPTNDSIDIEEKNGLMYKKGTSELFTGLRTAYFESGQISFRGPYVRGVSDGKSIWWHESGKKQSEGQTVNGLKEGEWKVWFEDGAISMVTNYQGDKQNGRLIVYHRNGKVASDSFKKDDQLQGVSKSFDEDGNIEAEIIYENGVANGRAISYYKNGQIENDFTYINGLRQGEARIFFPNGVLQTRCYYKDNKLDGEFLVYHMNKHLNGKLLYETGNLQGKYSTYDSLGHLLQEQFYKDSVLLKTIDYRNKSTKWTISETDTLITSKFAGAQILILANCLFQEYEDSFTSIKNDSSGLGYMMRRIVSSADYPSSIKQFEKQITKTNSSYKFSNLKTSVADKIVIETSDIELIKDGNKMRGKIRTIKKGKLIYLLQIISQHDKWETLTSDIRRIESSFKIAE